ncbi:MAG: DUF368 domain-containing protein [Firmicutes bacterium]|nr:DUF368 domain-containing protein [Candidatus Fiminaster equi]
MKKKLPTPIKDGLIGLAFGTGMIIPGIAGGTVLLIFRAFKKVVGAVANLFSKNFGRNFLILLPFGVGAILSFAALVIPLNLAMEYCMFAIICLFAGLVIGSLPGVTDNVKDEPRKKSYILSFGIFFLITAFVGVFSVIFPTISWINDIFRDVPTYLYFIMIGVGFFAAAGLVIPGFSGSLLLVAICFYQPILELFKFKNVGASFGLIFSFLVGAILGFVIFSKLMNYFLAKHRVGTYYAAIGMIVGSLISIFVNSKMFDYCKSSSFGLVDQILGPILFVLAIIGSYMIVRYLRTHKEPKENA